MEIRKGIAVAIACAALLGCQTMESGSGTGGTGGMKPQTTTYTVKQKTCKKNEVCKLDAFVDWVWLIFPKAAVEAEELVIETGNAGDVYWNLPANDTTFYFPSDGIEFEDKGKTVFTCDVRNSGQQFHCSNTGKPDSYKYTIRIAHNGLYFVWSTDPWVVN